MCARHRVLGSLTAEAEIHSGLLDMSLVGVGESGDGCCGPVSNSAFYIYILYFIACVCLGFFPFSRQCRKRPGNLIVCGATTLRQMPVSRASVCQSISGTREAAEA